MIHYLKYWSLSRRPFSRAAEHSFFAGIPQREAIAGLHSVISHQRSSALLVAPPRCGTTSLLRYVQQMRGLGDRAVEVIVTNGQHPFRADVQSELCRTLGYAQVPGDVTRKLGQTIDSSASQGVRILWLIDGAHSAAALVARDLVRSHAGLSVVLATSLAASKRRSVELGHGAMRIELRPLCVADTIGYVVFCLKHAGATQRVFSGNAMVRLHEVTGGALADLAVVAESALHLAANHRLDEVGPEVVEASLERVPMAA